MTEADQILELTRRALDSFDDPGKSVAALVRQAHRIAVRRHDYSAQAELLLQLTDVAAGADRADFLDLRNKLETLLGEEAGSQEYVRRAERYFATRRMSDGKHTIGVSIEQLESNLAQLESVYGEYGAVPANLTPIDTYFVAADQDRARAKLIPLLGDQQTIIARVKQSVHIYLTATESELEAGRTESSFFDHVQARINELLMRYAPEAARNFVAAQERIAAGGSEDISHALTSCRRMIKSIADALYPATDEKITGLDNVERKMSDEAYRNRLVQYVRDRVGKHKNGPVLQAVLTDIGSRLTAIDGLASKGVHADPSFDEARTCVAQTYLLAGELLSIAEETSYLLRDDPDIATSA
ncbi:hypothetical protein ACQP0C_00655 [Nocardia sp. CA-129566]|uniref:hypothetical protein n=1 Tax=Nocardia sp. CA-129566 TaxID=3239976 RepID=UPI003D969754